ncbi:MAG: FecR domain-containing protein [Pseudomonadota bacterium]
MKSGLCLFLLSIMLLPAFAIASADQTVEICVMKGDNLTNIGKKYLDDPKRWREIARLNRLRNTDLIYPGQKLMIPLDLLRGLPLNGTVTFVKGDVSVYIRALEEWKALRLNHRITQGSWIRTGDESIAEITFEETVSFLLRANTLLEILSAQEKSTRHRSYKLFLDIGRTASKLKEVTGEESRFQIYTPAAVAGARGTEFRLTVDSEEITRCEVLKGIINVKGKKQEVDVKEGEGSLVKRGEAPIEPKKLLPPPKVIDLKPVYKSMPLKFAFEKVEGASSYRAMLAKTETFKDLLMEKVIKPEDTLSIVALNDGAYFLQIRAIDEVGLEGPPSAPYTLKVRVNPFPPFIQSPVDGAEYRERSVPFKWLRVQDAVKYHVQVAEDPDFKSIKEERTDVREQTYKTGVLDFKPYCFRARSIAADGFEGIWSDPIGFKIIPPPPSPPVEAPKMDKENINIRWRNLGKDMTYHFQMAKDSAFKNIIIDRKLDLPEIQIKKPEEAGQYYVRTSAVDSKGYEGEFSPPQVFEVEKEFPYGAIGAILTTILIIILL